MIAKYVEKLVLANEAAQMTEPSATSATIEEALEDIRAGRMVVVCDAEDRENEGDLTLAAQFATPENINFMAREGRGLICLALTSERCDELGLDLMAAKNESVVRDRVHGLGRGARGRHHRHLRPRPRAHDPGRDRPALASRRTSCSPATSSRSRPAPVGCWSAPGRPRRASTSRGSPA